MKHTFDSICKMLDEMLPWFYPTGMGVWIKSESELILGNEEAGLMWPDMDDIEGWSLLATLETKPDIRHREFFLRKSGKFYGQVVRGHTRKIRSDLIKEGHQENQSVLKEPKRAKPKSVKEEMTSYQYNPKKD